VWQRERQVARQSWVLGLSMFRFYIRFSIFNSPDRRHILYGAWPYDQVVLIFFSWGIWGLAVLSGGFNFF